MIDVLAAASALHNEQGCTTNVLHKWTTFNFKFCYI